jgi:hypothetical protein
MILVIAKAKNQMDDIDLEDETLTISNTLAILKTTSLFNSFTLFNHEVCIHVLLVLTTKNNCQIFLDLCG